MDDRTATETLARWIPLSGIEGDDAASLRALFTMQTYGEGEIVYEAESPGEGLLLLLEGEVQLRDTTLATLGGSAEVVISTPGTTLSRGSLLGPFPHRHTVRATRASTLALLPRDAFEAALSLGSRGARAMLDEVMAATMRELSELNHAIHGLLQSGPLDEAEKEEAC